MSEGSPSESRSTKSGPREAMIVSSSAAASPPLRIADVGSTTRTSRCMVNVPRAASPAMPVPSIRYSRATILTFPGTSTRRSIARHERFSAAREASRPWRRDSTETCLPRSISHSSSSPPPGRGTNFRWTRARPARIVAKASGGAASKATASASDAGVGKRRKTTSSAVSSARSTFAEVRCQARYFRTIGAAPPSAGNVTVRNRDCSRPSAVSREGMPSAKGAAGASPLSGVTCTRMPLRVAWSETPGRTSRSPVPAAKQTTKMAAARRRRSGSLTGTP